MFERAAYPKRLKPEELDAYLAAGWFRMGQSIFTTEFVLFAGRIYRTIWLRCVLQQFDGGTTFSKLKKRNRDLRVTLKPAEITPEHEHLFELYRQHVSFDTAPSLAHLLFGYVFEPTHIYRTFEINLHDGDTLVACTYFDVGKNSAEGISAYYHPAYRQRSLGKYLIYIQIEWCRQNGFTYFYPGYFVPGYPHLDYKLQIGSDCLEFFVPDEMNWYAISEYEDEPISLEYGDYLKDLEGFLSESDES